MADFNMLLIELSNFFVERNGSLVIEVNKIETENRIFTGQWLKVNLIILLKIFFIEVKFLSFSSDLMIMWGLWLNNGPNMTHSAKVKDISQVNQFALAHIIYNCEVVIKKMKMNGLDSKNIIINFWKNKEIKCSDSNSKNSAEFENDDNLVMIVMKDFFMSLGWNRKDLQYCFTLLQHPALTIFKYFEKITFFCFFVSFKKSLSNYMETKSLFADQTSIERSKYFSFYRLKNYL